MQAKELLKSALQLLWENTGIELSEMTNSSTHSKYQFDALLKMNTDKVFVAEIKSWAQHKNTGLVINNIQNITDEFNKNQQQQAQPLLIADYINPRMTKDLQKAQVNYLDVVGNAYINSLPTFVQIEGKKKPKENKLKAQGRAFNFSGLKVIYALLINENLINSNYREIAKSANVALGSVGWVIKDLIDNGYIEKSLTSDEKKIARYSELVQKWVEEFPKLRRKIFIDKFSVQDTDWWKQISDDGNAVLGGEYAGAMYTKNLKPTSGTIYIDKEKMNEYLIKHRLAKYLNEGSQSGHQVELYEKFWLNADTEKTAQRIAHPILVYAELITSKDPRNREIANELAEKNIFN